jgi:hypothetical protein
MGEKRKTHKGLLGKTNGIEPSLKTKKEMGG